MAVRPAALWPSTRMQSLPRQAFAGSGTVSCSPTHLSRSRRPRRAHSTLTMCTPLSTLLLTLVKSARVALHFPKLHTQILANSDPFENTSNSQFGVNADEPWQSKRRLASNRPSSSSSSSSSSNQRWAHQDLPFMPLPHNLRSPKIMLVPFSQMEILATRMSYPNWSQNVHNTIRSQWGGWRRDLTLIFKWMLEPWPNLQGLLSSSPNHNKLLPNLFLRWIGYKQFDILGCQLPLMSWPYNLKSQNSQVFSYLKNSGDVCSYKLIPGQTSYQSCSLSMLNPDNNPSSSSSSSSNWRWHIRTSPECPLTHKLRFQTSKPLQHMMMLILTIGWPWLPESHWTQLTPLKSECAQQHRSPRRWPKDLTRTPKPHNPNH